MLLMRNKGLYKVVVINDTTLRMLQDVLKSTFSIHRATLASNSKRYCNRLDADQKDLTREESRSETDPEESRQNAEDLYVLDKIVRHLGWGSQLKYVLKWYV